MTKNKLIAFDAFVVTHDSHQLILSMSKINPGIDSLKAATEFAVAGDQNTPNPFGYKITSVKSSLAGQNGGTVRVIAELIDETLFVKSAYECLYPERDIPVRHINLRWGQMLYGLIEKHRSAPGNDQGFSVAAYSDADAPRPRKKTVTENSL